MVKGNTFGNTFASRAAPYGNRLGLTTFLRVSFFGPGTANPVRYQDAPLPLDAGLGVMNLVPFDCIPSTRRLSSAPYSWFGNQ